MYILFLPRYSLSISLIGCQFPIKKLTTLVSVSSTNEDMNMKGLKIISMNPVKILENNSEDPIFLVFLFKLLVLMNLSLIDICDENNIMFIFSIRLLFFNYRLYYSTLDILSVTLYRTTIKIYLLYFII